MVEDEILEWIKSLVKLADEGMIQLRQHVGFVIGNEIKDERHIEMLLDEILAYVHLGKGLNEFKRLNAYYLTINPENAEFYKHYLEKILSDE